MLFIAMRTASRAAECLDTMLARYKGYIQTDGYAAYPFRRNRQEHQAEKETIIHVACWVHPHRNFVEVPENSNVRKIVKLITKLYRAETELRDNPDLERATYRQQHAAPVLKNQSDPR